MELDIYKNIWDWEISGKFLGPARRSDRIPKGFGAPGMLSGGVRLFVMALEAVPEEMLHGTDKAVMFWVENLGTGEDLE